MWGGGERAECDLESLLFLGRRALIGKRGEGLLLGRQAKATTSVKLESIEHQDNQLLSLYSTAHFRNKKETEAQRSQMTDSDHRAKRQQP